MMHGIAPAPAVALAVEGVSHSYGPRQALADVTFSIAPATFAVLLGLNGAGKSTLFSLITRLYGTQRGQIRIFGHDVARTPGDALRLIGVVFQPRTLDLDLSVMQNLIYHAALHGIGRRAARRRAARDAGADRARRSGAATRCAIFPAARCAASRSRARCCTGRGCCVLDEPTVGLDIKARADILAHVRRLVAARRPVVLWATHLIDEISADDDVIVLHHGHVLAHGPVARVVATPALRTFGAHSRG